MPGIVVMSCLFGTSMTGSNLLFEMQTGSHERMLVTPLRRPGAADRPGAEGDRADVRAGGDHRGVVMPFGFDLHLGGVLLGAA